MHSLHKWSVMCKHYSDVIMGAKASQIISLTIVYSTVYSGTDQRKYQSSASLAFVWGNHLRPVNSPHKWPVTRKIFPFDDVIMNIDILWHQHTIKNIAHGPYRHKWYVSYTDGANQLCAEMFSKHTNIFTFLTFQDTAIAWAVEILFGISYVSALS